MECTCDIDCGEGESAVMIDESKVKALLGQKCDECRMYIPEGEVYDRYTHYFEGHHGVHRVCEDCRSVIDNLIDSWIFGYVWDAIREYLGEGNEIPEKCIAKLTPWARAAVCELIEECWKEREEEGYYG